MTSFFVYQIFIFKTTMACNKKTITNTGSTKVYFSYQACNDFVWNYDVPLNPGETKTIWYLNNTFSSPNTNLEVDVVNVPSFNVNAVAGAVTTYQLSSCCNKESLQYVTVNLSTPLSIDRDIILGDDNVCYHVLMSGYTNQPTITWTNGVLYRNTTDCTVCTANYRCAPPSTPTPTPTPSSCRRPVQVTTAQMFFAYTLSGVVTTFTSSFDSACYGCRIINQGAASGAYNVEIDGGNQVYNGLQTQGATNCSTIPDGYYVYVTSVSPGLDCRIAHVVNGFIISLTVCSTAVPTQTVTSTPTPTPTRNSTLNCAIAQTIPGIRYSFYDCCNNNALITGIGSSNIQYFNINMLYQYSGLILADVQFNCPTPTPTLTRTKTPTPTPTNPSSGTQICFTMYRNIDVGPLNASIDINGSGTYNGKPYYMININYTILWNSVSNRWELVYGPSMLTGTVVGYLNSANPNYPITDATHAWVTLDIFYMSFLTSVFCGGPTPTPTKTVTSTNPPPTPTPTTTTPNSGSSICFSLYPYIDIIIPGIRTTLGVNGSGTYNGKPYYLVATAPISGVGVYIIWNSTLNRWEEVEGYPTNFASALVLMSLNSANPNYPITDSTHQWTIVTLLVNHYYMSGSIFGTCIGQTPTPTPTNPPPTATPTSTHCSNDCYTFSINISANDILAATGNTGSYSGYNGVVLVEELLDCSNHFMPIITYSGAGSYQFCGKYLQYPGFLVYQNNIQQPLVRSTITNSLICCTPPTPTPTPTKTLTPTPPTTICFNWHCGNLNRYNTLSVNGNGIANGKPYYMVNDITAPCNDFVEYVIWNPSLNRWEYTYDFNLNPNSVVSYLSSSVNPNYPISDSTHPWRQGTLMQTGEQMLSSTSGPCVNAPTPTPTQTPNYGCEPRRLPLPNQNINLGDIIVSGSAVGVNAVGVPVQPDIQNYGGLAGGGNINIGNCYFNYRPGSIRIFSDRDNQRFVSYTVNFSTPINNVTINCGIHETGQQFRILVNGNNPVSPSVISGCQITFMNIDIVGPGVTTFRVDGANAQNPVTSYSSITIVNMTQTIYHISYWNFCYTPKSTPTPTPTQLNCVNFVQFIASTIGTVRYLDCCGTSKIVTTVLGLNEISDCIKINSLRPFFGFANPPQIGNINYSSTPCTGRTTAQLPCLTPTPTPTIPSSASTICFTFRQDIKINQAGGWVTGNINSVYRNITLPVSGSGIFNGKPYYNLGTFTDFNFGTNNVWVTWDSRWNTSFGAVPSANYTYNHLSNSVNSNYPISDSTHPWTGNGPSDAYPNFSVVSSVFGTCAGPTPTPTPTITQTSSPTPTTTQNNCVPKSGVTFQVNSTGTTYMTVQDCCGTSTTLQFNSGLWSLGLIQNAPGCVKVGSLSVISGGTISNVNYVGNCSLNCCVSAYTTTFQVQNSSINTPSLISVRDCCDREFQALLYNGLYNVLQIFGVGCVKKNSIIALQGNVSYITYRDYPCTISPCVTLTPQVTRTPTITPTKTATPTLTRTSNSPITTVECLTGLKIEVMYWAQSEWGLFHPPGYDLAPIPGTNPVRYYGLEAHSCSSAFFYIRANGVNILNANLNNMRNFGTGICEDAGNIPPWIPSTWSNPSSRYSSIILTAQDAANILQTSQNNTVTFNSICAKSLTPTDCDAPYASNQCHTDLVWVRISKPDGTVIFNNGMNNVDNYLINVCGPQPTLLPPTTPTPTPSQATPTPTKTPTSTPTPTGTFVYLGVNTVYMKFNYY